ncbi:hypothetical protein [Thalassospira aquimaris]|uniref:Uncharacterized protein n=1 Tax=Thalassospira aquimaris TaxID=3037796 RepID=A0ABT6GGD5_9PROT|nr:hypothetical protein [Thalassospira sp. FZY0004]MDG4721145.1 hypothetical protein [Thalassospira sp. FZY0004]
MVEFATRSGYDRRQAEISAAERLKRAAQMQDQQFENAQQDRARADALDAAERQYYSAQMGGGPSATQKLVSVAAQQPSGTDTDFRTAGFNPNAAPAASAAQTLAATARQSRSVNPADYFGNVHGGGKILAGIEKFQRQREDDAERNAVTAFRNGDWALFDHFQKQANLKLPASDLERAKTDSRFRMNMGNAALASEIYKANPKQAAGFLMAYMDAATNNPSGNPQDFVVQAAQRVGPPADKPNWTLKQLSDGAMVRINENSGDVVPLTMNDGTGKTIPVKGTGKTTKDLLFQVKLDAYKKAFPAASETDALAFANGDITLGSDPKTRATYFKIAADLLKDDVNSMSMSVAEKQQLLDQMATDMMGEAGNPYQRRGTMDVPNREAQAGNVAGRDQDNPAQVATQAEFDALPSGAYYVNPADGATYRKN